MTLVLCFYRAPSVFFCAACKGNIALCLTALQSPKRPRSPGSNSKVPEIEVTVEGELVVLRFLLTLCPTVVWTQELLCSWGFMSKKHLMLNLTNIVFF